MKHTGLVFVVAAVLITGCRGEGASEPRQTSDTHREVVRAQRATHKADLGTPLPEARTLREALPVLRARAQEGDARAACQLATNLDFCAATELQERNLQQSLKIVGKEPDSAMGKQDFFETVAELTRMRSSYCQGVTEISPSERIKYWRQAATNGHIPSILFYASGSVFSQNDTLEVLDELRVYKQSAVSLMQRAAGSGNLQANLLLAQAHSPLLGNRPIAPLFEQLIVNKDSVASLAYYMQAERFASQGKGLPNAQFQDPALAANQLRKIMSPQEIEAAQQQFQQLQSQSVGIAKSIAVDMGPSERDTFQPAPSTQQCAETTYARSP